MLFIRRFEEKSKQAFQEGKIKGFCHLYNGQEAVAVGVCAALAGPDLLLSSGRAIGPALARGVAPGAVMAELLGKAAGPCGGKGGRGHLAAPAAGFFGAHAVVGGNISIAAGVALAAQAKPGNAIVACIFGDGACGAGALHETMNIARLWNLPLVFVCDNNGYSVSTPTAAALVPRRLADLAQPFGIPAVTVDGMDVTAVRDAMRDAAGRARSGEGPAFVECLSARFASHSTSTRDTRPAAEVAALRERCPIRALAARLSATGVLDAGAWDALQRAVDAEVAAALRFADASSWPDASAALEDVA